MRRAIPAPIPDTEPVTSATQGRSGIERSCHPEIGHSYPDARRKSTGQDPVTDRLPGRRRRLLRLGGHHQEVIQHEIEMTVGVLGSLLDERGEVLTERPIGLLGSAGAVR